MNKFGRYGFLLAAAGMFFFGCSGGGADISNPFTGVISMKTEENKTVAGARVVIGHRGVDPGISGAGQSLVCIDSGLYMFVNSRVFDTTWTDNAGCFMFENIMPGEYTISVEYHEYRAIANVTKNFNEEGRVQLALAEPATVKLVMHDTVDATKALHVIAMRIAGTDCIESADSKGEVTIPDAPEGDLELLVYESDSSVVRYPVLRTVAAQTAVLVAQPGIAADRWVAHHSDVRLQTDRPYIVSTYFPAGTADAGSILDSGKTFDIRIQFSHDMDALRTAEAITPISEGDSITVDGLRWEGGNVLYVALCLPQTDGACGEFLQGKQYGVIIDTTAQSVYGISFGFSEVLRFTPVP